MNEKLWTTQRTEQLHKLAATGLPWHAIGHVMGLPSHIVRAKARREGLVMAKFGVSPGSIPRDPNAVLPLEERSGAPLAVMALTNQQCGWPIGDPHGPDFHYCSAPISPYISPPYCKEHLLVAGAKMFHREA